MTELLRLSLYQGGLTRFHYDLIAGKHPRDRFHKPAIALAQLNLPTGEF